MTAAAEHRRAEASWRRAGRRDPGGLGDRPPRGDHRAAAARAAIDLASAGRPRRRPAPSSTGGTTDLARVLVEPARRAAPPRRRRRELPAGARRPLRRARPQSAKPALLELLSHAAEVAAARVPHRRRGRRQLGPARGPHRRPLDHRAQQADGGGGSPRRPCRRRGAEGAGPRTARRDAAATARPALPGRAARCWHARPCRPLSDISVRPVADGDAEAIRAIYNPEVLESTVTFDLVPRTLDEQLAWQQRALRRPRRARRRRRRPASSLGFGSLSPYKDRAGLRHHGRGLGLRRAATSRAAGVGKLLLGRAAGRRHRPRLPRRDGAHRRRPRRVDRACTPALGFEIVGTEREVGRKFGRWLDVVVMQKLL